MKKRDIFGEDGMSRIRGEISKRNPWWISKNRYYELKYFCLQYNAWIEESKNIKIFPNVDYQDRVDHSRGNPTEDIALDIVEKHKNIEILARASRLCDPELGKYVLIGATSGHSYEILNANNRIPCCKEVYYKTYRKFFYILDKLKD